MSERANGTGRHKVTIWADDDAMGDTTLEEAIRVTCPQEEGKKRRRERDSSCTSLAEGPGSLKRISGHKSSQQPNEDAQPWENIMDM
ncbi:hypothetical protein CFAM422_008952 [Trichoderma lentiforme]|uniref:Uncharacterized protein n=1 Tax=Trichoderma lentiforme TaxID=1567552 RepID=A0A9P4X970_9HYPO|nr:hypothetical protein CFAM422_008952 [Trichoderma lentiforme]